MYLFFMFVVLRSIAGFQQDDTWRRGFPNQLLQLRQLRQSVFAGITPEDAYVNEAVRLSTSYCNPFVADCSDVDVGRSNGASTNYFDDQGDQYQYQYYSDNQDYDDQCVDTQPEGLFNCNYYVNQGICQELSQDFCARSCGQCSSSEQEEEQEKSFGLKEEADALKTYKSSLTNQTTLESWKGNDACNGWTGITCNDKGRVSIISLGGLKWKEIYQGQYMFEIGDTIIKRQNVQIPSEWSVFGELEKMEMRHTGVTGTIPQWMSLLTKLKVLDLIGNPITGTLPPELSVWNQIGVFTVMFCDITGTLPPEYSTLNTLNWFEFSYNAISGKIPVEYSVISPRHTLVYPQQGGLCTPQNTKLPPLQQIGNNC